MSVLLLLGAASQNLTRTAAQSVGAISEAPAQANFTHNEFYFEDATHGNQKTLVVPGVSWSSGDLVLLNLAGVGVANLSVNTISVSGLTFEYVSNAPSDPSSELWQAKAASGGSGSVTITTRGQADAYAVTILAVRHIQKPVWLDTVAYNDLFDQTPTISVTPTDGVGRLFTIFSVDTEATFALGGSAVAIRTNDVAGSLVTSSAYLDYTSAGLKTTAGTLSNGASWTATTFAVGNVQHAQRAAQASVNYVEEAPLDNRTRFYLPSAGAAAVNPAFSTWTETTGADRFRTQTIRGSSAFLNKTQAHVATAANSTFLSRMYVSDPIRAQTIPASTIKGTIRALESAANDNIDAMRLTIRVVSNDGATFRSPNLYGPTNGTVAELNTTLRAKRLAIGGATSSVTASAGDRIVIEIGTTNTTVGASLSDSINYGENAATALADNETDVSASHPFIEIKTGIVFSAQLGIATTAAVEFISEEATRIGGHPRTSTDTVGAITAVATAVKGPPPPTFARNADQNDSVASLTASVSRIVGIIRSTSDSLATLTESPSALRTLQRTVSATISTLTAAASWGGNHLLRTVNTALVGFTYGVTNWGEGAYGAGGIFEGAARGLTAFGRLVAESVSPITETVLKGAVAARAVAQSVGSISEAAAAIAGKIRSVADSLATLGEGVTRTFGPVRTVADSLATLSEAVSRGVTAFTRVVSDTLGAISEAVVAVRSGANNLVRVVADTMGGISEATTRLATLARSTSATVATLTETVVRDVLAKLRTVADSVATLSETVSQGAVNVLRSAADSLLTMTEALVNVSGKTRTVTASLATLTESVARGAAAFIRDTSATVITITEAAVVNPGAAFVRSVGASIGSLVETVANGAQVVGGPGPVIGSALHAVARGLGHSPKPKGSATHPKPRK